MYKRAIISVSLPFSLFTLSSALPHAQTSSRAELTPISLVTLPLPFPVFPSLLSCPFPSLACLSALPLLNQTCRSLLPLFLLSLCLSILFQSHYRRTRTSSSSSWLFPLRNCRRNKGKKSERSLISFFLPKPNPIPDQSPNLSQPNAFTIAVRQPGKPNEPLRPEDLVYSIFTEFMRRGVQFSSQTGFVALPVGQGPQPKEADDEVSALLCVI